MEYKDTTTQRVALIEGRIEALREELRRERLAAFIFPTTDPHNSEYTADHWKGREWISGFNGSAGTAVVTLHSAALWTDSRYFIAAAEQLKGTEYQLMKEKKDGTPTIAEWLQSQLLPDDGQTSNLKSQTSNLKSQTSNLKSQISNLKPQISNPKKVLGLR